MKTSVAKKRSGGRRAGRPIMALIAVLIGLSVLGGTAGVALGGIGAASSTAHADADDHPGGRPGPLVEP